MIQQRKPAQKLFTGLVGCPVELDDYPSTAPAPTPVEAPPTAKTSGPILTKGNSLVRGFRETLMLDRQDIAEVFDAIVREEGRLIEAHLLIPADMLQHRIDRLMKLIAASKAIVEGLAVSVMKIRRGKEDVLDKPTREKYKREENARIARSNMKLAKYRTALRTGNYHEKVLRYVTVPVKFRDVFDDVMRFTTWGEPLYEKTEEKSFEGIKAHHLEDLVQYGEVSGVYDLERYKMLLTLGPEALWVLGENSEGQRKKSWAYWEQWEDAVIEGAIKHGVLRPRRDLLEFLGLAQYVRPGDPIEADETENALAIKTGGACYGGGIKSAGCNYRGKQPRQLPLQSFDKGKWLKDGYPGSPEQTYQGGGNDDDTESWDVRD